MKLLIILSVIAYSYGAKLDRTYLPPASASSAGGSPGSLTTPFGSSLPAGLGIGSAGPTFGAPGSTGSGINPAGPNIGSGPAGPGIGSAGPGFETTGPAATRNSQEALAFGQQLGPSQDVSGYGSGPQGFGQGNQEVVSAYNQSPVQPERARASADRNAEILRYDNQNDGETYSYSYETSNGISAEESGVATNGVHAQGGYSYTDDDGQVIRLTYTADENGFRPQGDHLPTPHPIPEEIQRAIEQNARAAAAGIQEGAYQPEEETSDFSQQYYAAAENQRLNQGPAQNYGAPNGPANAGQSGPFTQGALAQEYGTPSNAAPSAPGQINKSFGTPSQSPSQQNGPSSISSARLSQPSFNAPVQSGPSQQYGSLAGADRVSGPVQSGQFNQASSGHSQSGYQYDAPASPSSSSRIDQAFGPSSQFGPSQQFGAPTGADRATSPARVSPSNQVSGTPSQSGYQYESPVPSTSPARSNQPAFGAQGLSGPSQQYGGPNNAQIPSGPAKSGQFNQAPNAPSQIGPQQYGAPAISTSGPRSGQSSQNTFGAPAQSGYQYNAPANSISKSGNQQAFGTSEQTGPVQQFNNGVSIPVKSQFNQGSNAASQPSQQYGGPSGAPAKSANQQTYSSSQSAPTQFGSFPSAGQAGAQPSASRNQANQDSGYQYNRPQSFGRLPQGTSSQSGSLEVSPAAKFNQESSPNQATAGTAFGPQASGFEANRMPQSASYQYNRPGTQTSTRSQDQAKSQGQTFGAPRQPPSFSPEEGYKY